MPERLKDEFWVIDNWLGSPAGGQGLLPLIMEVVGALPAWGPVRLRDRVAFAHQAQVLQLGARAAPLTTPTPSTLPSSWEKTPFSVAQSIRGHYGGLKAMGRLGTDEHGQSLAANALGAKGGLKAIGRLGTDEHGQSLRPSPWGPRAHAQAGHGRAGPQPGCQVLGGQGRMHRLGTDEQGHSPWLPRQWAPREGEQAPQREPQGCAQPAASRWREQCHGRGVLAR